MTWGWSDHACRFCGARLTVQDAGGASAKYECGNCTLTSEGKPDGICGCGINLGRPGKAAKGGKQFRCGPNPARDPYKSPAAIVILCGDVPV